MRLGWPRPEDLRADLLAGLTVAVVAIPQALAYAQLAGVPPHLGLYAACIPALVAALFGASAQLSTGPVALTALLTASSLTGLASPGSPRWIELTALLALGAGLMQCFAGLTRLGRWVEQLPAALMLGFVNAAALLIITSQLPALLGVARPPDRGSLAALWAAWRGQVPFHPPGLAFGLGAVLALMALQGRWPRSPAALLVVAGTLVLSATLDFSASGAVVGPLPHAITVAALPQPDLATVWALAPAMCTVAAISFLEVTSSARVIAAHTGQVWQVNQELVGQGLAKIASGLIGTFPVSGSFSRSAINLSAGARSAGASVFCALLVGVALLYAGDLLKPLPVAVLAALIVTTVARLLSPLALIALWREHPGEARIALVTLVSTLLSAPDIHYGLLLGLAALGLQSWLADRSR